ncbi:major facilitator superfamily domain-containing protein [Aspergillus spinulosporus]
MTEQKNEATVSRCEPAIEEDRRYEAQETRIILRKFDLRLLVLFTVINFFSFIDRVNIGNARLLGLQEDLDLSGLRFKMALTCLLVSYCLVELPSNILCKLIGGHIYGGCMSAGLCWGCLRGESRRGWCFSCRCCLVSISDLASYPRHELGFRTSIYISASSASGTFGRLKNIFFCKGLVSILLAIIVFLTTPSGPGTARFLTESQRKLAVDRIQIDAAGTSKLSRTRLRRIKEGITQLPIVACALGFFFGNTCAQSFSLFSPYTIQAMGYTDELAQLLSVGPYVVACLFSILTGYISDEYRTRGYLILLTAPLGIIGMAMLLSLPASMPATKYAVNNAATPTVKAVASGLVFIVGSLGGILAPWVYLSQDAPEYRQGHAIMFVFLIASWAIAGSSIAWIKWENTMRESEKRDWILEGLGEVQRGELSSRHPRFRYVI